MSFRWLLDPAPSAEDLADLGAGDAHGDQASAEAWLTANYLDLDALGVRRVSLFEEDRLLYGPMSLDS